MFINFNFTDFERFSFEVLQIILKYLPIITKQNFKKRNMFITESYFKLNFRGND